MSFDDDDDGNDDDFNAKKRGAITILRRIGNSRGVSIRTSILSIVQISHRNAASTFSMWPNRKTF
jgi:hypothetical protein